MAGQNGPNRTANNVARSEPFGFELSTCVVNVINNRSMKFGGDPSRYDTTVGSAFVVSR